MKNTALILSTLFLLVFLLPLSAQAQTPENPTLVGAGVRWRPVYDGSASQTVDLVPMLRYYGKPWFIRTTYGILEGGARTELAPGLVLGAQLAYEQGRKQSESDFLQDIGATDIDAGASAGLHLEWDTKLGPAPISVLGRIRQQVDTDRGAQADLRLVAGVYGSAAAQVEIFTQATWATKKSNQTYYGHPGFDPDNGLLSVSVGAQNSYDLNRHWLLVGSAQARWLQGDAANSPLAERTSNYYATVGVVYRF